MRRISGNREFLVSAGISLFTLILAVIALPSKTITYDGALYIDIARNLLHGITNYTYQGVYMMYRPPVYVYTLTVLFRFFSPEHHVTLARLVSAVFYSLTAGLTYLFALRMWNDEVKAILAAALYIFNPLAFAMGTRELVHSEFTFFYTLSIYLLYTGRKNGSTWRLYLSFIVAGIAILTRYTGLSIIGVTVAYLYLTEHWEWVKKREYPIGFALLAITLLPWLYMGHIHYGGAFKPFSVATQYVTNAPPVSAFDYIGMLINTIGVIALLAAIGFVLLKKDEEGWLLISWLFVGLLGIMTVTHKEERFITFLSPALALLAAHGLWGISNVLSEATRAGEYKKHVAVLLLVLFLVPIWGDASALKDDWDKQGAIYVEVFEYASKNYPADWLLVSQKMYTMAGLYYPDATIQVIMDVPQVRERISEGRYDVIVRVKSDPELNIESSGNYRIAKEFQNGNFIVYVRKF
ncbi:glycosyltransferase family 39 protein [Thermococcus sp. 21S7]|uniref:ArnT family glycosyltransferase n=1 Tax=Thermococcus sp. 21S7 TaxID=1638221 RepID=UPI00143AD17A|nr:glycosyltransferase family 39 protein [Thermococcus sp. 21S7]NJE62225.1 phospholipid carrier-dependent glycosyltransferase [Thermococcus sp. 21S7]